MDVAHAVVTIVQVLHELEVVLVNAWARVGIEVEHLLLVLAAVVLDKLSEVRNDDAALAGARRLVDRQKNLASEEFYFHVGPWEDKREKAALELVLGQKLHLSDHFCEVFVRLLLRNSAPKFARPPPRAS